MSDFTGNTFLNAGRRGIFQMTLISSLDMIVELAELSESE